ncbi:MAG: UDP-N-acetylenolpyruvoylglucosamine reductase [Candidatus Woesebacteria bacterium GW2011_GWA1_39_21]|uniref:UDP-N-acetylenolpyruvoylglucosamine reductase n=1 Tax=Candidatus Woesebacteria bacterium GW2011_GWA1_39_21 TaxID=1618550 RepID=A0A0G0N6G0_9BACT|nr:MAG: UDP-N-acetylenolpyruvoylglucosamine reductase [Candidatus Woesebacteria bacterium GW2011_GWA1_39_21]
MKILHNFSLKNKHSFKVDVKAKCFILISKIEDIVKVLQNKKYNNNLLVLGSGTNTLFTKDYPGTILQIATKGIAVVDQDEKEITVEIQAGESWSGFVAWAVNNGFSGVENMALIPGTVGAGAIQNIAAYGENFEDVFVSLEVIEMASGKTISFDKKACKFGYRESIFKKDYRNRFIITKVNLRLAKNDEINTSYHSRYGSLEDELAKISNPPYNIRDASKAVTLIRERKFPDWEKIGTAGSFFLNPVITKKELVGIQKKVPNIQFYPIDKLSYPKPDDPKFIYSDYVKIPAGWLLEELGWKGKWIGKVGTSPNQSLVVMTQKGATAQEILKFAEKMKLDVKKAYSIDLTPEVNII